MTGEGGPARPGTAGTLVVVATPIGNLDDLSPRAARALREADLVACEDTRRTAVLLRHAGSSAPMLPSHRHNEAARAEAIAARLAGGATVALVSDAGMPGVSDPGARAVALARARGFSVTVVPGPDAVSCAVAASGLVGEGHRFIGFLPRRDAERAALLAALDRSPALAVAFESPRRLPASLRALAAHDAGRELAVCRELTKMHEEVVVGTAAELAARFAEPPRGEVTLVIAPPAAPPPEAAAERLAAGMELLVAQGVPPGRAAEAAAALGAPRNAAYRAALEAAERRRAR